MKVESNNKVFEFLVDGKPLEGDAVFEAFVVLGSIYFPFAVVTRTAQEKDSVRAVTFAVDESYVDALVDAMEGKLEDDEEIGVLGLDVDKELS